MDIFGLPEIKNMFLLLYLHEGNYGEKRNIPLFVFFI